jgi:hypothetical protein
MKKLYLVSQTENKGWDTFDAMVVCAESEEAAIDTHPNPGSKVAWLRVTTGADGWTHYRKDVHCTYIGEATDNVKLGVVLASFNAG